MILSAKGERQLRLGFLSARLTSSADKQEKIHRARVVLKLISTKWGKRSRNELEDHRTKGMTLLDAMLNGTLELEPKKFIMGGNHTEPYPPNIIIFLLGWNSMDVSLIFSR